MSVLSNVLKVCYLNNLLQNHSHLFPDNSEISPRSAQCATHDSQTQVSTVEQEEWDTLRVHELYPATLQFNIDQNLVSDVPRSGLVSSLCAFRANLKQMLGNQDFRMLHEDILCIAKEDREEEEEEGIEPRFVLVGGIVVAALQANAELMHSEFSRSDADIFYVERHPPPVEAIEDVVGDAGNNVDDDETRCAISQNRSEELLRETVLRVERRLHRHPDQEKRSHLWMYNGRTLNLLRPKQPEDGLRHETTARPFQFVLKRNLDLRQVLMMTDLDCTRVAYDGKQVYVLGQALFMLNHRCNLVTPHQITHRACLTRINKYLNRGYIYRVVNNLTNEPSQGSLHELPLDCWYNIFRFIHVSHAAKTYLSLLHTCRDLNESPLRYESNIVTSQEHLRFGAKASSSRLLSIDDRTSLSYIHHLRLDHDGGTYIHDLLVDILSLENLETLEVRGPNKDTLDCIQATKYDDELVKLQAAVKDASNLKSIEFHGCTVGTLLSALASSSTLLQLRLVGCDERQDRDAIEQLLKKSRIEYFGIHKTSIDHGSTLKEILTSVLAQNDSITHLDMTHSRVQHANRTSLQLIKSVTNRQQPLFMTPPLLLDSQLQVDLLEYYTKRDSEMSAETLARVDLQRYNVSSYAVSHALCGWLEKGAVRDRVRALNLYRAHCKVEDSERLLEAIMALPHLVELNLADSGLIHNIEMVDMLVAWLCDAQLCQLKRLILGEHTMLSHEVMKIVNAVERNPNLVHIDIRRCKNVSKETIVLLRKALANNRDGTESVSLWKYIEQELFESSPVERGLPNPYSTNPYQYFLDEYERRIRNPLPVTKETEHRFDVFLSVEELFMSCGRFFSNAFDLRTLFCKDRILCCNLCGRFYSEQ